MVTAISWASPRSWSCSGPMKQPPMSTGTPPSEVRVQTRPPTRSRASRTTTERPACLSRRAAVRPARPAPTTQTSASLGAVCGMHPPPILGPGPGSARATVPQARPIEHPVGRARGWVRRAEPSARGWRATLLHEDARCAMSEFVMTINGEAAPTEGTFGVRNPATGEVFAQAPECSRPATGRRLRRRGQGGPGMEVGRGGPARRAAAGVRGLDGAGGDRALPDAHGGAGQAPERRRHRRVRLGHLVPVLRHPRDPAPGDPGRRQRLRRGGPATARGGGGHHAVELPADPGLLEDRPGVAGRQHARVEALALHAPHHAQGG